MYLVFTYLLTFLLLRPLSLHIVCVILLYSNKFYIYMSTYKHIRS